MRMVKPHLGLIHTQTLYSRDAPRGPKSERGTNTPRPHVQHCGNSTPTASSVKMCVLLSRLFSVCQGRDRKDKSKRDFRLPRAGSTTAKGDPTTPERSLFALIADTSGR